MNDDQQYINTDEIYLFNIGEAQQAYATFGCHRLDELGMHRFLVWRQCQADQCCGGF